MATTGKPEDCGGLEEGTLHYQKDQLTLPGKGSMHRRPTEPLSGRRPRRKGGSGLEASVAQGTQSRSVVGSRVAGRERGRLQGQHGQLVEGLCSRGRMVEEHLGGVQQGSDQVHWPV